MIDPEGCLGCQRHVGSQEMCLGPYKKILGTILIQFLNFHIFSFLYSKVPIIYALLSTKKRICGNARTESKSSLRFFYMAPDTFLGFQRASDIQGNLQNQSYVLIIPRKFFIGTNAKQIWFFRIKCRSKGGLFRRWLWDIYMPSCNQTIIYFNEGGRISLQPF